MALFRRPGLINPRVVPDVDVEVDWTHPLTAGLTGCYLPGKSLRDYCGIGPTLTPFVGTPMARTSTGIGLASVGTTNFGAYALNPTQYQYKDVVSIFWGGSQPTPMSGSFSNPLFGYVHQVLSSETSPYLDWCLVIQNNFSPANMIAFQSGATSANTGVVPAQNVLTTTLATYNMVANQSSQWVNGVSAYTNSGVGFGVPSYISTGGLSFGVYPAHRITNVIHEIGLIYHALVPAAFAAWLAAEPFAMLRPKASMRTWSVPSGPIRSRPRVMLLS